MRYELLVYVGKMMSPLVQEVMTDQPFAAFATGQFYDMEGDPFLYRIRSIHRQVLEADEGIIDRTALVLEHYAFVPKQREG